MSEPETRCGLVTLLGRTNVGKSTLLNALVGAKVSITTDRRQTTRRAVHGVMTEGASQVIFVDTPGLHRPEDMESERLLAETRDALSDVELVVVVVEPGDKNEGGTAYVLRYLEAAGSPPALLVVNKVDTTEPASGLVRETVDTLVKAYPFERIFPVSAVAGDGLELLREAVLAAVPPGPFLYPADEVSNVPQTFYAAEILREAAMQLTEDEIPHAIDVSIEHLSRNEDGVYKIEAVLFVDRESRKRILIGAGGSKIGAIRRRAKKTLEAELEEKVEIQAKVKVRKNWRNKRRGQQKKKKKKKKKRKKPTSS